MVLSSYLRGNQKPLWGDHYPIIKQKFLLSYQQFNRRILERVYELDALENFSLRNTTYSLLNNFRSYFKIQNEIEILRVWIKSSLAFLDNSCNKPAEEEIDWTRGRFRGSLLSIIVCNGLVIEKIFLTSKGSIISVKRSELGILERS